MFLITVEVAPVRKFRYRAVGKSISFTIEFDVTPRYEMSGCSKTPFIEFKGEVSRDLFNPIVRAVELNQMVFKDELESRNHAFDTWPDRDRDPYDSELWDADRHLFRRMPLSPAGLRLDQRIAALIWQNQD